MNSHSSGFDFDADIQSLEKNSDYFEQKKYLVNKIIDFKQHMLMHPDVDDTYLKSLELEVQRLDSTAELDEKKLKSVAKHIRLSCYIESHNDKFKSEPNNNKLNSGPPAPVLSRDSIKAFAHDRFVAMDARKKLKYFFLADNDPNLFLNAVAEYFTTGKCILPRMVMQNHCKTKLCIALYAIYRHCRKDVPLNEYSSFIKFLKILPAFEEKTDHQIYKSLTRECG